MKQCSKCPWRTDVDPHNIPNGYDVKKHRALKCTIARADEIRIGGAIKMMACHESATGKERPCVGWLANQLGPGNNIALRMWAIDNMRGDSLDLVGEQHERFEDTLP